MAGFDVGRTVYRLTFDDPRFEGFTVDVAAMSVAETWAYNDALAEAKDADAYTRVIVNTIGRQLLSWNATKDGQPVPASLDGLLDLDDHYASAIITGWLKAIRPTPEQEPDPTQQADSLLEGSLPMSPLTESAASESAPAG